MAGASGESRVVKALLAWSWHDNGQSWNDKEWQSWKMGRKGSSATKAKITMDKELMAKFQPKKEEWNRNQPGYHAKAFHLVSARYQKCSAILAHCGVFIVAEGPVPPRIAAVKRTV